MKPSQLPEEVVLLMEQFLRDMNRTGCAVFGIVYSTKPALGIGLLRNIDGDPAEQAENLLNIIRDSQSDGRVQERPVRKVQ